jgi:hypothetical protein
MEMAIYIIDLIKALTFESSLNDFATATFELLLELLWLIVYLLLDFVYWF